MEFKVGCSYETHDFDVVMKFTVKKITDFCLLVDVYEPEYLKEKDMMIGLDSFLAYNAKLISASEEIHITVKGDKTYAVLKENGKVTKRSVAKCSLNDDFNFETGAKVAFERLFEKNSNASELKTLYLKNKFTNEIYGAIGEETQLRDINDEHLCIGDVVEVFGRSMNSLGEKVICFDGNNKEFYVSGLFGIVFLTGNELGFRIVKRKSYVDLKSGDKINNFKVIEGDFVKRNGRYIKC